MKFGPKRGHFMFIFERFFRDFGLLIGALLLYLIIGDAQILWQNSGLLVIVLIAPITRLIQYRCTYYSIDDKQLVVQTGLLNKRRQEVPLSNITTVDFSQNLFFQLAKVYSVNVDNASSISDQQSGTVKMVLRIEDAVYVKKLLLAKQEQEPEQEEKLGIEINAAEGALRGRKLEERISQETSGNTILATAGEIFLMGLLRSKAVVVLQLFTYCGVAISVISKIFLEKEVDGEQVMTDLLLSISAPLLIAFAVLAIYLLGILVSVALSTVKYYGFRVTDRETSIFIEYGLLTRKTHTLMKEKISGVCYRQSLLMRIFGRGTLEIFAAGYGGNQDGQEEVAMLYPVMRREKLYDFLERFLPEVRYRETPRPAERKAMPYFFLCPRIFFAVSFCGSLCAALLLASVPKEFFPWFMAAGGLVLALAVVSVILEYKNAAMSASDQLVTLVSGGFNRETVLLKMEKVEFAEDHASQRKRTKKGIASISVGILAPTGVCRHKVRNLGLEVFADLRRRLIY